MTDRLDQLHELGQDLWLDSIRRSYLGDGAYLDQLIAADDIQGLTSNPTIFAKAVADDDDYDAQLAELSGSDPRDALWTLIKADIADACDAFAPQWESSGCLHGQVSIEVDPAKAFDTEQTVAEALHLVGELDRPNLMVKVPGTEPGLAAITRLIAAGINVNVTLLFSVERYREVVDAYLAGLERRADADEDISQIASVASFFVSRVDAKVDALLGQGHPRIATAGIANARSAYGVFTEMFNGPRFAALQELGARCQRPLWASTSPKGEGYRDVVYVEELAGPDTVTTVPEKTLDAFRDHGVAEDRLSGTAEEARRQLARLAEDGVDLAQITKELESEGVEAFVSSFEQAVATVAEHLD